MCNGVATPIVTAGFAPEEALCTASPMLRNAVTTPPSPHFLRSAAGHEKVGVSKTPVLLR